MEKTEDKGDLDLGDILANISGGDAVNTTKVKKQAKAMTKDKAAPQLTKPVSGIKKLRIMREKAQ